jgi:hypothetical protein
MHKTRWLKVQDYMQNMCGQPGPNLEWHPWPLIGCAALEKGGLNCIKSSRYSESNGIVLELLPEIES